MKYRYPLLLAMLCTGMAATAQRVQPIGLGVTTGGSQGIHAVSEDQGLLYLGGRFSSFNGEPGTNIHAWDGVQSVHLQGAFSSLAQLVRALAIHDGDLIAGGSENTFGNVARWDGSAWNAMGSGLPGQVYALKVFNDDLYAAGAFNGVAHWDGSDWNALGDAFNGTVERLEVYEEQLYAAGSFTANADGTVELKGIARWNGSAWEQVLNGLNGNASGLLSTPQGLVIGGAFTANGDEAQSLPNWTIYDGSSFSEEDFAPGPVLNVASMPDGGFLLATASASHRWLGGSWERIRMPHVNGARSVAGRTIVAGQGAFPWQPENTANGIGVLLPGQLDAEVSSANVEGNATIRLGLFQDHFNEGPGFQAPAGSGLSTLYSASPWIAARQPGLDMWDIFAPTSAQTYASGGPHATTMDDDYHARYNQVWAVHRQQIETHIAQWDQPGYVMPHAIAAWPGNGDAANGEPEVLAPWADLDLDGIYEPELGEHPIIRGDRAVYMIHHTDPDDENQPAWDIHIMHYAYDDPDDPTLANTLFTHFGIVNREDIDREEARFALFADFDIGCYQDDFAECDPDLDLFFAYNGAAFDADYFPASGYGEDPPAQGAVFLGDALATHRSYAGAEPLFPIDGFFGTQFGQPFDYGDGPTTFQFPGASYTEGALGSTPGERRSVGATGPFSWAAGETRCFDVALVFAQRTDPEDPSAIDILKARTADLRDWYDEQAYDCSFDISVAVEELPATTNALRLYPNPSHGPVTLQRSDARDATEVILRDATGAVVLRSNWPAGAPMQALHVQGLADGLYIVEVIDRRGRMQQRLVKTGH